jgi:hypothetical protein
VESQASEILQGELKNLVTQKEYVKLLESFVFEMHLEKEFSAFLIINNYSIKKEKKK